MEIVGTFFCVVLLLKLPNEHRLFISFWPVLWGLESCGQAGFRFIKQCFAFCGPLRDFQLIHCVVRFAIIQKCLPIKNECFFPILPCLQQVGLLAQSASNGTAPVGLQQLVTRLVVYKKNFE